jgi:hypothetical protein
LLRDQTKGFETMKIICKQITISYIYIFALCSLVA